MAKKTKTTKRKAKKPVGRPRSVYTRKLSDEICDKLIEGLSLRQICRDDKMPGESTVRRWAKNNIDGFKARHDVARELQMDTYVDQCIEIADDTANDYTVVDTKDGPQVQVNREVVERSRLRIQARQWLAARINAQRYGPKGEMNHNHTGGVNVYQSMAEAVAAKAKEEADALRMRLKAAAKNGGKNGGKNG